MFVAHQILFALSSMFMWQEVLNDDTLKIEMAKYLKFVYKMKHGGEDEIIKVCKSLTSFEKSSITTLLTADMLEKILEKSPNVLEMAHMGSVQDLIRKFDSDGDLRLDKKDVMTVRLEFEKIMHNYNQLAMML